MQKLLLKTISGCFLQLNAPCDIVFLHKNFIIHANKCMPFTRKTVQKLEKFQILLAPLPGPFSSMPLAS